MSDFRQTDIWSPSVVVPISQPDPDAVGKPWWHTWPGGSHMPAIIDALFKISTDWSTQDTRAILGPLDTSGQYSPQYERIYTTVMNLVESKEPTGSKAADECWELSHQLADFSARGSDAVRDPTTKGSTRPQLPESPSSLNLPYTVPPYLQARMRSLEQEIKVYKSSYPTQSNTVYDIRVNGGIASYFDLAHRAKMNEDRLGTQVMHLHLILEYKIFNMNSATHYKDFLGVTDVAPCLTLDDQNAYLKFRQLLSPMRKMVREYELFDPTPCIHDGIFEKPNFYITWVCINKGWTVEDARTRLMATKNSVTGHSRVPNTSMALNYVHEWGIDVDERCSCLYAGRLRQYDRWHQDNTSTITRAEEKVISRQTRI